MRKKDISDAIGNINDRYIEEAADFQRKKKRTGKSSILQKSVAAAALSLIHISEPTRPRLISYAVFCLKKNFFNDTATTEIYTV